jgi:hypothetical protein
MKACFVPCIGTLLKAVRIQLGNREQGNVEADKEKTHRRGAE